MKQMAVVDYQIEVIFLSVWFWKLLILHTNQKGFFPDPVYKHLKGIFTYTRDENSTRVQFFFSKEAFLKNEWRNSMHY